MIGMEWNGPYTDSYFGRILFIQVYGRENILGIFI